MPLLRAALDTSFEQALTMEEYAEANCFSTRALAVAAEAVRTIHTSMDGGHA
jgi:2-(1,2-epoxy-1,2-dihydrophenyl)acetyl-CoA isomerase